jgi:PAS domain S-box-containing protein
MFSEGNMEGEKPSSRGLPANNGSDVAKIAAAANAAAEIAASAAAAAAKNVKDAAKAAAVVADKVAASGLPADHSANKATKAAVVAATTAAEAVAVASKAAAEATATAAAVFVASTALTAADEAEKYNRLLIEASLDPLVTIGPDGKIADVNAATEKVTGLPREQLTGTDFADYFTDPENAERGYRQVFEKGSVQDYPLDIRHKSGRVTPVLYNASVYRDESGNVAGVFAAARDITRSRLAEEALSNTATYSRSLIESSLDPLATIGLDGKIADVNAATEKVTGLSRKQLIGTDFAEYFTDPVKAREGYETAFRLGAVYDYPLVLKNANGELTPVMYNASVYRDEAGKIIGVFAAARDVTESTKAVETIMRVPLPERAKRQASRITKIAALSSAIIGALVMAGWIFGIETLKGALWPGLVTMKGNAGLCAALAGGALFLSQTKFSDTRERARSMIVAALGWVVALIAGLTVIEYLFSFDFGIDQLLFNAAATAGQLHPGRMAFVAAVCFFLVGVALVLPKGRRAWIYVQTLSFIVLWLALVTLLGLLYGATALYMFNFSVAAAHVAAVALVFLAVGLLFSRAEDGFAFTMISDLLGGKMARRLLPVFIVILVGAGLTETAGRRAGLFPLELGVAVSMTFTLTSFIFLVWLNARSLNMVDMDYRNAQIALRHNLRRITETQDRLADANAELEKKVTELAALNAELEAFSFAVSHDLRSPLRSIDGFSQIIAEDYADKMDETERDYFKRIRAAATRMGQLIDDILKLSRITRGDMKFERLDMSEMAAEVVNQKRDQYPGQKVSITIEPDLIAMGDKGLVMAALENLFDNAFKFTSKTENTTINFGRRRVSGEEFFFIEDNGAGFDQKYVDKLFKPFQRLHQDKDFPGTGIGLATVQRIVNRHGGKTMAKSETEKGAVFYFSLASRKAKGVGDERYKR